MPSPSLKVDWPHLAVWLLILAALTAFWVKVIGVILNILNP